MADLTLQLGDVEFQEFEIPDEIRGGGAQILEVHKRAGGTRTIDTFGADDEPLSWSGIFFDESAESRCQQLDAMRKAGAAVSLSWSSFSYQVVISKFTWTYRRFYEIGYSIELEVVSDDVQPVTDPGIDAETDMQADLDDASGYADDLNQPDFTDALGDVTAALAAQPSIKGGSVPFLTAFSADIATAQGVAADRTDAFDGQVDSFGQASLYVAGANPAAMVLNLLALDGACSNLPIAFGAQNTMAKLGKSVASILTGG